MIEVDRLTVEKYQISIPMTLLLVIAMISAPLHGQVKPSEQDFLLASAGMGVAIGLELFAKDHFMPSEPRLSDPNQLDLMLRSKLYLGTARQAQAELWSDRLIYGVSLSSLTWGPLLAKDTERAALINMEVFSINSVITNLIKVSVARERPYHYFKTRHSEGAKDFASFFSGHSSVAFSQAVTNAMILSQDFPKQEGMIWSSLLTLAGATAYLRVAGDMHYFSDIVVGAGVGSLIAWSITRYELERFGEDSGSDETFVISFKIPLG